MEKFTPEYIQNVQQIIKNDEKDKARELLKDLHPADIAELYQQLNLDEAEYIYMLLDGEKAADVLLELDEDDRKKMLKQLPSEVIAKQFIDYMDSDDAVDLIREMDEDAQEEILSHIDDVEQAGDIVDLLKYDEDTAGGLMGTEMVVVNENWSMPECVKQMRIQAEELGELYYVYVVDDDDRLKGVFPLKKMITNPSASKIKHVMRKDPVSVKTDTPIEEVAVTFEKYDLVAVPVIDSIGRLVGQITVDDVMDEVREQSEREYQLASGLSQDVESNDTVFTQTAARLPWLLIGMFGGLANSVILGNFEANIARNPATALFIPLIGGTGGNVGARFRLQLVLPRQHGHHRVGVAVSLRRRHLRLDIRYPRTPYPRTVQNRPRHRHRPLHHHYQRHHRHAHLHEYKLYACPINEAKRKNLQRFIHFNRYYLYFCPCN